MNVSSIANLATSMANAKTSSEVGVAVLKTAMSAERSAAVALLDALPPPMPRPDARVGTQFSASA